MSINRDRVERYNAAFGRADADAVAACVADGVEWELNGELAHRGKEDFVERIRGDMSTGRAEIQPELTVQDGDVVVVFARGRFVPHDGGDGMAYRTAEAFTLRDGLITRIRTVMTG